MNYRIYFYWENRPGATHKDAQTHDGAIAIAKVKAANHKTLMSVEIVDDNYSREFISREELCSIN